VGPIDPAVCVLCLHDKKGDGLQLFVNFAMHLDSIGGNHVSADYPAYMTNMLQEAFGEQCAVLFGTGCCGDINRGFLPGFPNRDGVEYARNLGAILGGEAIKACHMLEPSEAVQLGSCIEELTIPIRQYGEDELALARRALEDGDTLFTTDHWTEQHWYPPEVARLYAQEAIHINELPPEVTTLVQVLRIGDVAIVGLPGEMFVEIGLDIKQNSPHKYTFIVELANDYVGYVPTERAFDEGGYEVRLARSSKLAPQARRMLTDTALRLLAQ